MPRKRTAAPGPARRRTPLPILAAVLASAVHLTSHAPAHAQHYVAGSDSTHPRLRYADSLLSVNDRCIVSERKLNPRMSPVYVNGQPVGFC